MDDRWRAGSRSAADQHLLHDHKAVVSQPPEKHQRFGGAYCWKAQGTWTLTAGRKTGAGHLLRYFLFLDLPADVQLLLRYGHIQRHEHRYDRRTPDVSGSGRRWL